MDLVRLRFLMDYWAQFPPVHVSVALYLGLGKKERAVLARVLGKEQSAGAILDSLISEGG